MRRFFAFLQDAFQSIFSLRSLASNRSVAGGFRIFTEKKPDKKLLSDIEFALMTANELALFNIGQIVVVKRKSIMAVNAAESCEETIARGADLAGKNAVVVKTDLNDSKNLCAVCTHFLKLVSQNKALLFAAKMNDNDIESLSSCIKFANDNGLIFVGIVSIR